MYRNTAAVFRSSLGAASGSSTAYERDNSFDDSDHLSAAGADFKVSHSEYAKVVNQMFALGLIEPRPHPTLPASTIWFATPYGCRFGAKMVAIRRDLPGPATT
jgi:hypothetical protein